ncbi:unnamed protein product [Closterium sp. NIES-54]
MKSQRHKAACEGPGSVGAGPAPHGDHGQQPLRLPVATSQRCALRAFFRGRRVRQTVAASAAPTARDPVPAPRRAPLPLLALPHAPVAASAWGAGG